MLIAKKVNRFCGYFTTWENFVTVAIVSNASFYVLLNYLNV